ncbi:uncharacterized protein TNCV_4337941 [Trichonephila clavipes]|uniref:Uncharacterized protein n=1 Tax=Trichonephila clavipes TaxID=2585209 RepID=A0A8X6VPX3_TRICX|nr:uncharacterized protein TNCV_4337941 [Trichonephila clavipes]
MLVDTDIAVWGALSDAEIVTLDHNNTETDEDESEELTPVTLSGAKVSLKKLRNFSLQNHVDEDILQASFVLEKSIDKWLATLTAVPLGLGSNPEEDMDVCECIVPSGHGSTLNSRRAASPLVRLVEGEERWEAPDHPQGVLPQNWGETELNRSVACMVLKATANDSRHIALCHDEILGP